MHMDSGSLGEWALVLELFPFPRCQALESPQAGGQSGWTADGRAVRTQPRPGLSLTSCKVG